jgi:IclR family pca regulon transcriptional regulator
MESTGRKTKPSLQGHGDADKEFMATLAKGLAVLGAFGRQRPAMTLSEAAEIADLSRAAARRVLRTLSMLGYVEQQGRNSRCRRASWNSALRICRRKAGSTACCP